MRRSNRVAVRPAAQKAASPEPAPSISAESGAQSDDGSDFQDNDTDTPEPQPEPRPSSKKRARVDSVVRNNNSTTTTTTNTEIVSPGGPRKSNIAAAAAASKERSEQTTKRKRAKTAKNTQPELHRRLFSLPTTKPASPQDSCSLPDRQHAVSYHRPLLLDSSSGRESLLSWFDSVSTDRSMPWRKAWINPFAQVEGVGEDSKAVFRKKLERRAYEVWISEIMLQQTRVAVVIDYWNRWISKWPTIHELAAADPDDVLAAWRGLGYYSRATRIHEAAKLVTKDEAMCGLLPSTAEELQAKVPGVGRYTGGAISAIVFGKAAPMVDGNVLRVLSRQLGLLGDVKTDKAVIDLLWAAADALVKAVARDAAINKDVIDDEELLPSDRPGRWGQALMELGSTVCQPKPNCDGCPITTSCRAYSEGLAIATKTASKSSTSDTLPDIEDACTMCSSPDLSSPLGIEENGSTAKKSTALDTSASEPKTRQKKQASLQSFFAPKAKAKTDGSTDVAVSTTQKPNAATLDKVANYAKQFPLKTIKKAAREEETLVCAIRREDGQYLIQRRPDKGLLAGMWEFPGRIIDASESNSPKSRKKEARRFVESQVGKEISMDPQQIRHVGELDTIPWLFSHIKLSMHVHLFEVKGSTSTTNSNDGRIRWTDNIDDESMGTGMRKCVALVQDAVTSS